MDITLSRPEFWSVVEKLVEAAAAVCPITGAPDAKNAVAVVLAGFAGVSIAEDADEDA
ncbi:hypothetical protein [Jiella marina]|uniref:hypothetical protein n=1 Tax=Jiella sp. LLJ827 TaxID=2917712 RepID=UPI002100A6BA|nr:hypothetical protein [Jiella sp. LLJ827]MCQ0989939.1 hypothetical protein [Jiella sp. LLJ827]